MKKLLIVLAVVLFEIFTLFGAGALVTNSSNYGLSTVVVSNGGTNSTSPSFFNSIIAGVVSGIANSPLYKQALGFFFSTFEDSAPVVTITSPQNNSVFDPSSTIYFNITLDKNGTCQYSLDGGLTNMSMTANSSGTGFNASNSSIGAGQYTMSAYCASVFGTRNYGQTIAFTVISGQLLSACANLNSPNAYYQLITNITPSGPSTGACLNISASGVVLDCKGYSLSNSTYRGSVIWASRVNNVTIQNCNVSKTDTSYATAIYLSGTNNTIIKDSTASYNYYGAYLYNANSTRLLNFTAVSNQITGIYLIGADNLVANSSSVGGIQAVYVGGGFKNNVLRDSNFSSGASTDVHFAFSSAADCNIQLVNITGSGGKSIGCYNSSVAVSNQVFSQLFLCNADYSSFDNITIVGDASIKNDAFDLFYTDFTNLSNINSSARYNGISLTSSNNNRIINSTVNNNYWDGIEIDGSNNTFDNITAYSNFRAGLELLNGKNNSINNILSSYNGAGLSVLSSYLSTFTNITLNSNSGGVFAYNANGSVFNNLMIFNCSGLSSFGDCIHLDGGGGFNFNGGVINKSSGATLLINLFSSSVNTFKDLSLVGNSLNDVSMVEYSLNNVFLNTTYSKSKEVVDSSSQLTRSWYYQAYVNDSLGNNLSVVNVSAFDSTGLFNFFTPTDTNGYTQIVPITDYINRGVTVYSSNYTIFASKASYNTENHSYNSTLSQNNLKDVFTLFPYNRAPDKPVVTLASLDGTNRTKSTLNCSSTITDPDGNTLNVSVQWYRNGVLNSTVDYNNSYSNGTQFGATLNNGNLGRGNSWNCSMRLFDGRAYSAWGFSNNITILNSLPTVTLSGPSDGSAVTNRTPDFNWTGTDDDGDPMVYELNITAKPTGSDDNRYYTSINTQDYAPPIPFKYLYDYGYTYQWNVRAYDGSAYGPWTSYRTFNVTAVIITSLPVNSVDFGSISLLASNDTTTDSPKPFVINNTGNVLLNVSVYGSDLWQTFSNPSQYYKFKVRNVTGQESAFNWVASLVNWVQMPSISGSVVAIDKLNYSDSTHSAKVDVYVQVPPAEPPSQKNSTITFVSSLGE